MLARAVSGETVAVTKDNLIVARVPALGAAMDGLTLRAEDLGLSDDLLARIAQGESVSVMRGSRVVARVVAPASGTRTPAEQAETMAVFREIFRQREVLKAEGVLITMDDLRAIRDDPSAAGQ